IKAVYDRYSATEKSLSEAEKKLEKLKENMPVLEKSCATLKSAEEKASREFDYARDTYNKVSETAEFYRDVVIQRKNVETARKSYETARKKHDMKNSEYNAKYRDFLDAQAGFMARELKNGEPCPVCGSTEHPRPCTLEINSNITREVIDKLKAEADTLRKLQEEKSAEARSAVDRLADMEKKTAYKSEKEAENALESARNDMNGKEEVYRKAVQETRKAEKYRTETAVLIKKYIE
ncbi:MAG: hypothetical protein K2J08_13060, partial [Ruminococcus sp.]|nr:hypothetical protein [Ruminococcus sp.]